MAVDQTANTPLIQEVSQFEVDFVIPRLGKDLPLGIDPFLLFKSRDPQFLKLHSQLLDTFNMGIDAIRSRKIEEARRLFQFPEVSEIGLGYTVKGKRGAGVGEFLTELVIETLLESRPLLKRGVRHIEEMQLVSLGIGRDRVSDIAANIFKEYLITYTQAQCQLWNIPLKPGVPVNHIFDPKTLDWYDGYYDLPISPFDSSPILLVPRRIVRTLPWINYDDFFKMEFATYLRAKRVQGRLHRKKVTRMVPPRLEKEQVIQIVRKEIERIERFVTMKEANAAKAQPSITYLNPEATCPEGDSLKDRLQNLPSGPKHAAEYQRLTLEIFNFLFSPDLIDGELEVRTVHGTERRDIIFTNDSDGSFWDYIRNEHSCLFIMLETKNTNEIEIPHINQTAAYLGDRIGYLGFIVSRNPISDASQNKIFAVYNDSHPRKIILTLADKDMNIMLKQKCRGEDPMRSIQKLYRKFRTSVQ
jgi:hypothetical protein